MRLCRFYRLCVTAHAVPISVVARAVASPQQVRLSEKEQRLCRHVTVVTEQLFLLQITI